MRAFHLFNYILILSCCLLPQATRAQIIPDATLPANTTVTVDGSANIIEGGTTAGGNLFHSFQEFSLKTGSTAYFNNSPTIQNILTRVTGGKISNIDGLIRANGSANLFFINPSGIVFGPNARLNMGGSFMGSTANSIQLSDGSFFSAANPQTPPLLTVSVPIGLQFGPNPGAIRVTGSGHSLFQNPQYPAIARGNSDTGFSVSPGNTLALVGGDIAIEGGVLTAAGGRIELGSVGEGNVSFTPASGGWTFDYSGALSFRDIRLSQKALADVSATPPIPPDLQETSGGGSVSVQGRGVSLGDGSVILNQNFSDRPSGSITVQASESVELSGTAPDANISSALNSETFGTGSGGNIAVSARHLLIQNGASVIAKTFSAGQGGNITANTSDSVQVIGFSPLNPSTSSSVVALTYSSGKAGDVRISTRRVAALGGGNAVSITFGTGDGGNVSIRAPESVEVLGSVPIFFTPSLLSSATAGAGDAGSLAIDTSRLIIRDGGRVDASTIGSGSSGSVTVNATDSVEVSGTVPGSRNPSLIISSANLLDRILQEAFGLPAVPSGASGNVTINAPVLRIRDGAQVTVKNDGSGNAGTLQINAGSIFLDNRGSITAATTSGEGGNITLKVRDTLQLRNASSISAEAGGSGTGGNLTINASTIAALENSDIAANAVRGQGGNILISTSGIFGATFRSQVTTESDITASSELGISGTVTVSNPEINQNSALVELPQNLAEPAQQIVAGCAADSGNVFAVTGRGGLPSDPTTELRGVTVWSDLRPLRGLNAGEQASGIAPGNRNNSPSPNPPIPAPHPPIQEATGIAMDSSGKIRLVAVAPGVTSGEPWQKLTQCGGF